MSFFGLWATSSKATTQPEIDEDTESHREEQAIVHDVPSSTKEKSSDEKEIAVDSKALERKRASKKRKGKRKEQAAHRISKEALKETSSSSKTPSILQKDVQKKQEPGLEVALRILDEKKVTLTRQEAQKRELFTYLNHQLGVFFLNTKEETASDVNAEEKTTTVEANEQSLTDLQLSQEELEKKDEGVIANLDLYTKEVYDYGEGFLNTKAKLAGAKEKQKIKTLRKIDEYRIHYKKYDAHVEIICAQRRKVEALQKGVLEVVNSLLEALECEEKRINKHFLKIQKHLLKLENVLEPTRNPLSQIVYLPVEKHEGKAYLLEITQVAQNSLPEKIASDETADVGCTPQWAIAKLVEYYQLPAHQNHIIASLGKIFQTTVFKKSKHECMSYGENDFTELFDIARLLAKEGVSLVDRLSDYVGEIASIRVKLKTSERDSLKKEGQQLKNIYADLFQDGVQVLEKIQARKKEIVAFQEKFMHKMEVCLKDLDDRKEILDKRYNKLVYSLACSMDYVRSGRITCSTQWGEYFARQQRGFNTPNSKLPPISEEYSAFIAISVPKELNEGTEVIEEEKAV